MGRRTKRICPCPLQVHCRREKSREGGVKRTNTEAVAKCTVGQTDVLCDGPGRGVRFLGKWVWKDGEERAFEAEPLEMPHRSRRALPGLQN